VCPSLAPPTGAAGHGSARTGNTGTMKGRSRAGLAEPGPDGVAPHFLLTARRSLFSTDGTTTHAKTQRPILRFPPEYAGAAGHRYLAAAQPAGRPDRSYLALARRARRGAGQTRPDGPLPGPVPGIRQR